MEIRPLSDHVVVKPITEETTALGIVLPETATDKPQRALVVAVGSGRLLDNGSRVPLEVKEGDVVLFQLNAGTKVRADQIEYLLLREQDVLAVLLTEPQLV